MKKKFEVIFLEDALSFMVSLGGKEREKIIYNIRKSQSINDKNLFKKLDDDIWVFRTLYNRTYYRLFAFWDKSKNAYMKNKDENAL